MKRFSLLTLWLVAGVLTASATTTFHLHLASGTVAGYQSANKVQGTGITTSVTGTTNGGTDIQVTDSNGGSTISFISPPLNAFTLSGTVTFNIWGLESAAQANATFRGRLYKYHGSEGSEIFLASSGTELTGSATVRNFTGTPTSTAFAAGDQLVIKVFITNAGGTMGNNRTVTMDYDGASVGADGDTYVTINETVGLYQAETLASTLGLHDSAVVQTPQVPVTVADTAGLHCALCFQETVDTANETFGIHDAASVNVTNSNTLVTAADTFGVSDALQCCQITPLTQPTLGLHDVLAVRDARAPALASTMGVHDAVTFASSKPISATATLGLHQNLTIPDSRNPALANTFGITTSPFVLVSHTTSLALTGTLALHLTLVAAQSIHPAYANTFGMHVVMTSSHIAPRVVSATLGLHDVAAVRDTAITSKSDTLGLHLSLSVVKNAVSTGQGMVVIT